MLTSRAFEREARSYERRARSASENKEKKRKSTDLADILIHKFVSSVLGEAEKELLFPCMNEVKSKLQSSSDMDDIAFVENLFEQKDFQDATNVSH